MCFKQIVFILIVSSSLSGGTTGKLTGVVKDEESGNSLIGCNIIINGTLLGASSNEKGDYYILNIPPGKYNIRYEMMGYKKLIQESVSISIDKTTKQFEIISMGHRNPQGLVYIKESDIIINTEHDPKGGDEIKINFQNTNQIPNFGWDISSYGTEYDGTEKFNKIINEDKIYFSQRRIRDIEYDYENNVLLIIFEHIPSLGVLKLN